MTTSNGLHSTVATMQLLAHRVGSRDGPQGRDWLRAATRCALDLLDQSMDHVPRVHTDKQVPVVEQGLPVRRPVHAARAHMAGVICRCSWW
jgi:hypothetical protein